MKVILLHSPTLVMKEIRSVLDKRTDVSLISLEIPITISSNAAEKIFSKIKPHLPAVFFSVNDGGTDYEGIMHSLIEKSGSYLINWYHDYPFYNCEFHSRKLKPFNNRVDFISEFSYVKLLESKGFNSYFLPLATDPKYFQHSKEINYERDIAFVGNSTLHLMDRIITKEISDSIEKNGYLFLDLQKKYVSDPTFSIRDNLLSRKSEWVNNIITSEDKFIFAMEWMIGYQYRRDIIVKISEKYKNHFTVFGDPYWKNFITESPISPNACYYDNLSHYYQSSKINLNINRVHIHTSFTQRHFDTKACGSFLLTEKRALNSKFFKTEGGDQEIVEFVNLKDCKEKIDYYLSHEDERLQIGLNGMERILSEHTYEKRFEELFRTVYSHWGI